MMLVTTVRIRAAVKIAEMAMGMCWMMVFI